MRFEWRESDWHSSSQLIATGDSVLDADPTLDNLVVDMGRGNVTAEKLLVASVLVFGTFVGGSVSVGRPVSRLVAEAVEDFFPDRRVRTLDVSDEPIRVWPSAGTLYVTAEGAPIEAPQEFGMPHNYALTLLDSAKYQGAVAGSHAALLATNIHVMNRFNPRAHDIALCAIAVGLLLSDDLHMLGIHYQGVGDESSLSRARSLLRSVGAGLTWDLS